VIVVEFQIGKIKENVDMPGPRSIARRVPPGIVGGAARAGDGRVGREILTRDALCRS
jgi:hypothetical protein